MYSEPVASLYISQAQISLLMSCLFSFIIVKELTCNYTQFAQQFQARKDLLILLSGSFAVFLLVSLDFIPFILAQNDALRGFPTFLLGALRSDPGFSLS